MDWATVANLILEIGLPAAEKIISNWENKQAVTLAEFKDISTLADRSAKDRMLARIVAAGIDPNSPQGKILLGLTDAPPLAVNPNDPQQPS